MEEFFIILNWFLCLVTALALLLVVWRQRFLLLKPSLIVVASYHLMIQWSATLNASQLAAFLPDPWTFALLAHGFPLAGLLVSVGFGRRQAREVWHRLQHPVAVPRYARRGALGVLAGSVMVLALFYLLQVPFQSTGLYAVFFDPANSALAREYSLKLLDSPALQYGFSFMALVFSPLLAVLLAEAIGSNFVRRRLVAAAGFTLALGGVLVVVSLTGARSFAVTLLLTVVLAWYLRRGLPVKVLQVVVLLVCVLTLPTLFTIFREGKELTLATFGTYLQQLILDRVLYVPMETAMWYTHYAQTNGFWGVAAIPKLATLLGVQPVNVMNVIGLAYTSYGIDSIYANTGYVFAYYSYFGLIALPFCLLGLWFLDVALLFYQGLSDNLLLACVASVSVASLSFVSVEYTTVWLTNGFGILLGVCWLIDRLNRLFSWRSLGRPSLFAPPDRPADKTG